MSIKIILKYFLVFTNLFIFILLNICMAPFIFSDKIRCMFQNINSFFWFNSVYYFLKDSIIIVNSKTLPNQKINIINANHTYQIDLFVLNYLFYLNNLKFYQISSISSNKNISLIDRSVLKLINACMVNNINYQNTIKTSISKWYNATYNRYVINFFEGITKSDFQGNIRGNIMNPKKLGFYHILNNLPSDIKYITDLNILYTLNDRILQCSNDELIFLILKKDVKIYIQVNNYLLPKKENSSDWLSELYKKKDKQIDHMKKQYNLI